MKCTLCKKSSSKLVTYRLCDCCSERVEHGCREAIFFVSNEQSTAAAAAAAVRKVECDICLEPVLKENLEQHRELCCVSRTVFRCTICDADYQHKTGLWEHLTSHEIHDETKEEHAQETNVMYDFHKCALCEDQRVYRESFYWKHIHEDHDGFFLKCLDCDENFRSLKLQDDHYKNHCKARQRTPELDAERDEERYEDTFFQESEQSPLSQNVNLELDNQSDQSTSSSSANDTCPDCGTELGKRTATHYCEVDRQTVQDEQSDSSVHVHKQCSDCGRKFRKLTTYARHICEAETKVQNSVEANESAGGEKPPNPPQCSYCKRIYKDYDSMMLHVRTFHKKHGAPFAVWCLRITVRSKSINERFTPNVSSVQSVSKCSRKQALKIT
nr:zinc finger protein 521-like isoform X3 [Aedes albopictus]